MVVLPIFPLPGLTFFPHTLLPLHVFEARYRAMVTDCLARDRRLAVVGLKPGYEATYDGKPEVYAVAGAGEIVRWERLATGRFNILVRGDCRVRIETELPTDTLYRVVRARVLEEAVPQGDGGRLASQTDRVKAACLRLLEAHGQSSREVERALRAATVPGVVADQIASAVIPDPLLRQELLGTLDVGRRLDRLAAALEDLLRQTTS
ncbi:MAG: LON peptidase substrate-binding domain-containing protein [Candidatus Rokubacteria bacterium]|nr:LON peptidase substrate-binding domain-containing protein [Candidatus Rokubacteria bacterium]